MSKTVFITVAIRVDSNIDDDQVTEFINECDHQFSYDGKPLNSEIMSVETIQE